MIRATEGNQDSEERLGSLYGSMFTGSGFSDPFSR